jgi:hypothetical protein
LGVHGDLLRELDGGMAPLSQHRWGFQHWEGQAHARENSPMAALGGFALDQGGALPAPPCFDFNLKDTAS